MVLLALNHKLAGAIAIGDTVKSTSTEAIKTLQARGLDVALITGDNRQTAAAIARQVGIERVMAEVLPGDKAAAVQQLQADGARVAMVGDGINDAPALAQADIGFAIGAGSDIAIEAGDVTLVRGDLTAVGQAIALSQATLRTIHQNLFWAFIYNIVLIPVAMLGGLLPMFAAGGDGLLERVRGDELAAPAGETVVTSQVSRPNSHIRQLKLRHRISRICDLMYNTLARLEHL